MGLMFIEEILEVKGEFNEQIDENLVITTHQISEYLCAQTSVKSSFKHRLISPTTNSESAEFESVFSYKLFSLFDSEQLLSNFSPFGTMVKHSKEHLCETVI